MDIGKQQRVIMVEPEQLEMPEPVAAEPEEIERVGEWPLPIAIEPEPVSQSPSWGQFVVRERPRR